MNPELCGLSLHLDSQTNEAPHSASIESSPTVSVGKGLNRAWSTGRGKTLLAFLPAEIPWVPETEFSNGH